MNAPISPPDSTEPCSIETLYIENHAWLRNWLAYRLRSWGRGVADDLAQDTFLRVLASREGARVEPIRQPRAYLTRIANCVLVSWRRRQSLEQAWLEALLLLPEPEYPSPELQCVILETLHEIDAVLHKLRPRARQAFLMATLDGMKHKDIAVALNIALPTVKKYIHDGYLTCLTQMPDD
ncbi:sigma-70 family RNA polymerase sigma factor [Pseudomonas putida]|uniref:RNA polymerase sigma factor n=1 Tax=Pseudomonas putida TaxID=303 RepID=A0A1L7N6Q4_PSEPU|nr:sigma-70 family RNA polymerase sigma factor [Pseudomonas putida]KAF0253095.1 sigma-70 family RNA polymerase sigma factor [Pseudomonas putida]MBH3390477.1 sigma-70 family RNA polymerase sigma factor [Pseudomonas putida]MBH3418228.1 sigma-70 family RNA polymerase sigma factor [Pseudomonas putida]MCE0880496.1 sigma-70 family RNA polymerase sigma factor [Pseudomonas putida]MCE0960002.1 sigma-70 family RNA polymerase sigma factor [Pseudomonas putida]